MFVNRNHRADQGDSHSKQESDGKKKPVYGIHRKKSVQEVVQNFKPLKDIVDCAVEADLPPQSIP